MNLGKDIDGDGKFFLCWWGIIMGAIVLLTLIVVIGEVIVHGC